MNNKKNNLNNIKLNNRAGDKPKRLAKLGAETKSLLTLLVVASIGYSTYMVYFGTHDTTSKLLLIPQVVYAVIVLLDKFSK